MKLSYIQPASATVKRGRPRISGQIREPNGRVSRAKKQKEKLALTMRAKHYGLTLEQAADPKAATHLGRLCLQGKEKGLSQEQYDAAIRFLNLKNEYQKSLLSPGAFYEQAGTISTHGDLVEYEAWVERVKKRYQAALKALQEAQFDNAKENIFAALQYVIIKDQNLPHLLGAARLTLNALDRHFSQLEPRKQTKYSHISLGDMRRPVKFSCR